jgi:hypothetical protein
MAPRGRFELPTFRLTAERSTIELPGNGKQPLNLQYFAGLGHAAGLDVAGAGGCADFSTGRGTQI